MAEATPTAPAADPAVAPASNAAPEAQQPLTEQERLQRFAAELQQLSNKYGVDIVADGQVSRSDTGVLSVFGVPRAQLRRVL